MPLKCRSCIVAGCNPERPRPGHGVFAQEERRGLTVGATSNHQHITAATTQSLLLRNSGRQAAAGGLVPGRPVERAGKPQHPHANGASKPWLPVLPITAATMPISEEDVGITEFATSTTGFSAILKHRCVSAWPTHDLARRRGCASTSRRGTAQPSLHRRMALDARRRRPHRQSSPCRTLQVAGLPGVRGGHQGQCRASDQHRPAPQAGAGCLLRPGRAGLCQQLAAQGGCAPTHPADCQPCLHSPVHTAHPCRRRPQQSHTQRA